jgi:hypothetical protein
MKNMKQLLALVLGLTVGYQAQAIDNKGEKAGNIVSAVVSEKSHYCKCNNNTLETVSCATQCPSSGWSGKSYLDRDGVVCICKDGSRETAPCTSTFPVRCGRSWAPGFSGFSGEVYSVETGKFERVPA